MPCGKFSLGFSRLFQAFPGFPGNPEIKEKAGCVRNHSSQKLRAFLHIRKSLESEEIFFLGSPARKAWKFSFDFSRLFQAFPGFPGNPGIKEEPGCASNHSSQKLRAFLHIRKSLESEEIFFLGSPGFSRNSWKARGAPDTLGFSGLFPGFSLCAKKPGKPGILPRNSEEFLAPFCRGVQLSSLPEI